MVRKLTGIWFIMLLVLPFTAYFFWVKAETKSVRKQTKRAIIAGLSKDQLVYLKFSRKESKTILNWKHDHEFEFQGKMFDVVESGFTADSVFYWCWPDKQETHLNNQLKNLADIALGVKHQKSKPSKFWLDFLTKITFEHLSDDNHLNYSVFNFPIYHARFHSVYLKSPPSPPPKYGNLYLLG